MSKQLHRLVYYSANHLVGTAAEIETEIQSILAASRRNNPRVGVTGALMYNTGCFAQVLEGGRAAIEHVFERIQQDHRHAQVSVLAFEPAPERGFADWSMAFASSSAAKTNLYRAILSGRTFDPGRMSGDDLFQKLHSLVLEEEHAS